MITFGFELATPEQVAQWELDTQNTPDDFYEEGCENVWDADGNPFPDGEVCGGKVVSTGGQGYYNGSYQCYTMYLRCDRCGDYEVECV